MFNSLDASTVVSSCFIPIKNMTEAMVSWGFFLGIIGISLSSSQHVNHQESRHKSIKVVPFPATQLLRCPGQGGYTVFFSAQKLTQESTVSKIPISSFRSIWDPAATMIQHF